MLPAGVDTLEAERMVHAQAALGNCDTGVALLNDCGGHAQPFHYHERMSCLHTEDPTSGHSTITATMLDGKMLYGKWEDSNAGTLAAPLLDACNGHFGANPDSPGVEVYHYHVSELAPFTTGCFGPAVDPATDLEVMVTIETCRDFHASVCGDGDQMSLVTVDAAGSMITVDYDPDCPCFDGEHSNTGAVPLPFESGAASEPTPAPTPVSYCPEGYDDYGVRYNWGLGKITITSSHEECSARCTQYSAPEFNGGCKAYMTGMYFGMLFCRSYGGNLRTQLCADWAVPTNPGVGSGALGAVNVRTNQMNIGGNCCSNSTFVGF